MSTILPGFNEKLIKFAHEKLEQNGIEIMLETAVKEFDGRDVTIGKLDSKSSKRKIGTHTLVWTAGVTPVEIIRNSIFKTKKNQIVVDEFLETPGFSGVFAIGDCAHIDDESKKRYPPTAQLAEAHAKLAAYNIKQDIDCLLYTSDSADDMQ